jgi:hypothetical protein
MVGVDRGFQSRAIRKGSEDGGLMAAPKEISGAVSASFGMKIWIGLHL